MSDGVVDLDAVLAGLVQRLEAVADVRREELEPDAYPLTVWVTPRNPGAIGIWLWGGWFGVTMHLASSGGGLWELEPTPDDATLLVDLVESVVAGRVRELVFPGRSRVEVTLADGSVVAETAIELPIPLPGWRRWARVVDYEAYDTPSP